MRTVKLIIVFAILPCFIFGLKAQDKTKSYNNQQWIQYYTAVKLSDKFIVKSDAGFRVKNNFENKSQHLIRTGLYYKIMPRMQFGVGTGVFAAYDGNGKVYRNEYRSYEELLINDKYENFKAQHRFRIEQRYMDDINPEKDDKFYHRFRYRFLIKVPLINSKKGKLDLNLADEIFFHGGKDAVYNMFNQNRVMIGSTYTINKNLALTLTYTSQYASKASTAGSYVYSNIMWLGIKQKFNSGGRKDEKQAQVYKLQ